jgi:hypothetical protein
VNNTSYSHLLKYGATFMLGACAQMPHTQPPTAIQPLFRVSNSVGSAYGSYILGTYYAGQNRLDKAIEAYGRAIELEPDMAEARNARAMLHADQGRYDAAISDLVIAVRASPNAAKLHNNLGYAHYLKADYAGAVNEFRSALALDAHNTLASNNLQASCEKMGVVAQRHLVILAQGESRLIEATPPCAGAAPANHLAADAADQLLDTALSYLRRGAAMVTSLPERFNTAQADAVAPQAVVDVPSESTRAVRLEIANGNGVPGLARRVRDALHQGGSPAPRLTNLKSFTQRVTAIQYRRGFHDAARLLSLKIPSHPGVFHDAVMGEEVDVRLVLGKDLTARAERAIKEYAVSERYAGGAAINAEAISGESNARTVARE